jgi:hypothetical protein
MGEIFVLNAEGRFEKVLCLPAFYTMLENGKYYTLEENEPDLNIFKFTGTLTSSGGGINGTFQLDAHTDELVVFGIACPPISTEEIQCIQLLNKVTKTELAAKKQISVIAKSEASVTERGLTTSSIQYEINENDNELVRIIKENINSSKISLQDLYERVGNQSKAYNLFYGLSNRQTITYEKFCQWMKLLNCKHEIVITKI